MREIVIANRHPRLRIARPAILRAIQLLDAAASRFRGGCPQGELSLVILTDAEQAQLHADFLNDPTTTDVITFEGQPDLHVAGEICVSADTAAAYAKAHKHDFSTELTLYLVHGWLHLAGYDDHAPATRKQMRTAERQALAAIRAAKKMPEFAFGH